VNDTSNGLSGTTTGFTEYQGHPWTTFTDDKAYGGDVGFYIYADGYGAAKVTGNVASGNSADGFGLVDNYQEATSPYNFSTFSNNTSVYNGGDGFDSDSDYLAKWTGNTAGYNTSDGFYFEFPKHEVVDGNLSQRNGGDGFDFFRTSGNFLDDVSLNKSFTNGSYAYDSDSAPTLLPGHGNADHGNVYGCKGVNCSSH
jgi:hypothetical protein